MQAYQRLQIQQQMLQAQRNVSGPIRQQEQQVSLPFPFRKTFKTPVAIYKYIGFDNGH